MRRKFVVIFILLLVVGVGYIVLVSLSSGPHPPVFSGTIAKKGSVYTLGMSNAPYLFNGKNFEDILDCFYDGDFACTRPSGGLDSMAIDEAGNLWMIVEGGIAKFELQTKTWSTLRPPKTALDFGLSGIAINSGKVYIGAGETSGSLWQGLLVLDIKNEEWRQINDPTFCISGYLDNLEIDKSGKVWNRASCYYNTQERSWENFSWYCGGSNCPNELNYQLGDSDKYFFDDEDNLVVSADNGVFRYDFGLN